MAHTLKTLRLNIKEAQAGRTWLLLPESGRDRGLASEWPLPDSLEDLRVLASIPFPRTKQDAGTVYLRRAKAEWERVMSAKGIAVEDTERAVEEARSRSVEFQRTLGLIESEAQRALQNVRERADKAVASLDSLFELGREGIEGQMKAHLEGVSWHNETISAHDFRQCFNMVARTVKGLGLPSEERAAAREVVMKEVASSIRAAAEAAPPAGGDNPS